MSLSHRVCLFCLSEKNDGIFTYGDSEEAENARNIINLHFWFDIDEINSVESFVCHECWNKVHSFHEFYVKVESAYSESSTDSGSDGENDSEIDEHESIGTLITISETTNSPDPSTLSEPSSPEPSTISETTNSPKPSTFSEQTNSPEPSIISEPDSNVNGEKVIDLEIDVIIPINLDGLDSDSNDRKHFPIKNSTQKELRRLKPKQKRFKDRNVELIICYICHKPFKSFGNLRRHLFLHDPNSRIFKCKLCDSKFAREYLLRNHIKYVHELRGKYVDNAKRKVNCSICDKRLAYGSLKLHIATVHDKVKKPDSGNPLECNMCGKVFKGAVLLAHHQLRHVDRKLTEVQCDICGRWVKNKYILRTHKNAHTQSPKKCPHCDKIKPNEQALKSHISTTHSIPKHKCTICNKAFTRPQPLKEHIATHTGKPLYNCSYCLKPFKCNANMYKHMKHIHKEQWNSDRVDKRMRR